MLEHWHHTQLYNIKTQKTGTAEDHINVIPHIPTGTLTDHVPTTLSTHSIPPHPNYQYNPLHPPTLHYHNNLDDHKSSALLASKILR